MASGGWSRKALEDAGKGMAGTLFHRGPDSEGAWTHPHYPLTLVHRRLAIQDLSAAGHQPMASATGRFHVVLNGEIYNFQILAQSLRQMGHRFRGHSDTEVLLAAIEEWGIEQALTRSRGMFALAVWDEQARELILCRDRMGEKPLFFGWVEKCFVFASELKALQSVFHSALTVDHRSLAAFFRFGYVPTPYSIYQNFFKLLPGCFLRIPVERVLAVNEFHPLPGGALVSPQPYWEIEAFARKGSSDLIYDEGEAVEQFDDLLRDTVTLQKIADVPLGAFLSGGVDSSLVSAVLQAVSDKPVKTFTVGFKEKEFDEAPYARSVAKHLGTEHHEYYISANDGLELIEDIPRYWDEPFADSSQIPSLLVARKAREEVTVCLSGDGGDELFCGYNRYFSNASLWSKKNKLPLGLRKLIRRAILALPTSVWQDSYGLLKRFSGNNRTQSNVGLKMQKLANLLEKESFQEAYLYLMSYWENPGEVLKYSREASSIINREPNPGTGHPIYDAMYWDQLGYLVDDNLVKGDRASMAVGLETRMPLLDHRIVEFSWRLPLAMKYRRGQSKWLLRQALYSHVPKKLIERPKMGFSVPIRDWLRGPLKNWAGDLIFSISDTGLLNPKKAQDVWGQHLSGSHDHSQKLWTLCMWLSWFQRYHH